MPLGTPEEVEATVDDAITIVLALRTMTEKNPEAMLTAMSIHMADEIVMTALRHNVKPDVFFKRVMESIVINMNNLISEL